MIKRELELQWNEERFTGDTNHRISKKHHKDFHLDEDRRLMAFSYTPDSFSMLIAPMIIEK